MESLGRNLPGLPARTAAPARPMDRARSTADCRPARKSTGKENRRSRWARAGALAKESGRNRRENRQSAAPVRPGRRYPTAPVEKGDEAGYRSNEGSAWAWFQCIARRRIPVTVLRRPKSMMCSDRQLVILCPRLAGANESAFGLRTAPQGEHFWCLPIGIVAV